MCSAIAVDWWFALAQALTSRVELPMDIEDLHLACLASVPPGGGSESRDAGCGVALSKDFLTQLNGPNDVDIAHQIALV